MRFGGAILLLMVAGAVHAQPVGLRTPAETVSLCAKDAARIGTAAKYTRWLDMASVPVADREEVYRVLCGHMQQLSRASDLPLPVIVPDSGGSLLRINLDDYGMKAATWEQLAESDPYFHQLSKVTTVTEVREPYYYAGGYASDGRYYRAGTYYRVKRVEKVAVKTVLAPWLTLGTDGKKVAYLVKATGSEVPVVNAGWFFNQTAAQADRKPGYYGMLGVKNQKDYEKLIGFDKNLFEGFSVELRASVAHSGVTLQPRAIVRRQALGGGYWVTLDFKKALKETNPLRVLGRDIEKKVDALETIGALSNGFLAFGLFNRAGKIQDTAPDFIASDGFSRSTDRRVHANVSCMRCHEDGYKNLDDWSRDLLKPPFVLQSKDYKELRLLRQQYLRQIEPHLARDRLTYAAAVKEATGMEVKAYHVAYAKLWETTEDAKADLAWFSRHMGIEAKKLQEAIARSVAGGYGDPVLAAILRGRSVPRLQAEEVLPVAWEAVARYRGK